MFKTPEADIRGYKEPTIPPYKYVGTITKAEYKTNDNNGREMLSVGIKISDTVPSGQDFDPDLFLDPYDSMIFDNIMEPIDGDHPFFAKNCRAKMQAFIAAMDTVDAGAMIDKNVQFTVQIRKDSGEAEIKTYFPA